MTRVNCDQSTEATCVGRSQRLKSVLLVASVVDQNNQNENRFGRPTDLGMQAVTRQDRIRGALYHSH